MRKFTLASLLLTTILLTNFSFAQTCDSTCTKDQIQFHLVNDYSVSYLKMLSPTSGLRYKIDLGLSGSSGDTDATNKQVYGTNQTSTQDRTEDNNSSSQYVNLVFNYMMFYKLADEVSFYWGAGPLLGYSRFSSETNSDWHYVNQNQNDVHKGKSEYSNSTLGIGLQLALGMEVLITQKLSLVAEFNLNGTYSWNNYSSSSKDETKGSNQYNSESKYESDGTSWNYGLNRLKLGIAYRF
ncbi:MAG: hypothetical protein A2499_14910 [Stygiobacter sp. RIFOXYC12_FULL_38_8]|nr:MAG: hypothetical protein A2279_09835 [Stygiobacter sp. RIFOXYA12_FULL_38_9]OGV07861.1 MAG: hypothetical protein A2299_06830 [Stygiobacter sp. RIFOXYB2_FULL_37_11]OGV11433.1 MAG: hypothetical protein A2237_00755 [Stygiobacter sp. RIFOXYA2_FULL_38_8]OGV12865.1 MAG: hypothetical protein A2440_16665 [Stygiobacter sp. RIFOXYC2_FULL_38_25]OGV27122.1 MAG: hypothetical protein A2499_14910 [Stygiobacter sp. RIFOXYC12_FULL_38_8]OGV81878.1 MAG: hypothetical protein A2X65_13580 [Stygiobacter sp. GWF2_